MKTSCVRNIVPTLSTPKSHSIHKISRMNERLVAAESRAAASVHFGLDPENKNVKNPDPEPTGTHHKESIKTSKFLSYLS